MRNESHLRENANNTFRGFNSVACTPPMEETPASQPQQQHKHEYEKRHTIDKVREA